MHPLPLGPPTRLRLEESITSRNAEDLYKYVKQFATDQFPEEPKDLQVQSVMSLVHQKNTFLLAGTGFGKSRIADIYYKLFQSKDKPVVPVLNPLDALGVNQVEEKKKKWNHSGKPYKNEHELWYCEGNYEWDLCIHLSSEFLTLNHANY